MALEQMTYSVTASVESSLDDATLASLIALSFHREAGIQFPEACESEASDVVVAAETATMTVTSPLRTETVKRLIEEALTKEVAMKHPSATCSISVTSIQIVEE